MYFNLTVIGKLKTVTIMANIKISCLGTDRSSTEQHEIEVFYNQFDEIYISIKGDTLEYICLDKSTAIKLSKILRTEINKIES